MSELIGVEGYKNLFATKADGASLEWAESREGREGKFSTIYSKGAASLIDSADELDAIWSFYDECDLVMTPRCQGPQHPDAGLSDHNLPCGGGKTPVVEIFDSVFDQEIVSDSVRSISWEEPRVSTPFKRFPGSPDLHSRIEYEFLDSCL